LLILCERATAIAASDERVTIRIASKSGMSIGAKRNEACRLSSGELICHWDDDDYSAPQRVEDQVARLLESGKAVTGYHSMRFTDGQQWKRYENGPDYALGTSLLYRKEWWERHPFLDIAVEEDNAFVAEAARAGQLISVDAGTLMHATTHSGNTSPRRL